MIFQRLDYFVLQKTQKESKMSRMREFENFYFFTAEAQREEGFEHVHLLGGSMSAVLREGADEIKALHGL